MKSFKSTQGYSIDWFTAAWIVLPFILTYNFYQRRLSLSLHRCVIEVSSNARGWRLEIAVCFIRLRLISSDHSQNIPVKSCLWDYFKVTGASQNCHVSKFYLQQTFYSVPTAMFLDYPFLISSIRFTILGTVKLVKSDERYIAFSFLYNLYITFFVLSIASIFSLCLKHLVILVFYKHTW